MVIRCSLKLLRLIGLRDGDLSAPEPSPDDWHANFVYIDRRKCLLVIHAGTLFPIFEPDVRKAQLVRLPELVCALIRREQRSEDLPLGTLGAVDPITVTLARTTDRRMLGYLNQIALECRWAIWRTDLVDAVWLQEVNRELRRTPRSTPGGYVFPIDLVGREMRRR